ALEVLEPVRGEDEVVVEACEEEGHEHVGPGELAVAEDAEFHQRRRARARLEVVLPGAEGEDQEQRDDDENGHPRRAPPDHVAFGE
nr:hypothetical protein [Tanacetum cinerariifolium]